MSTGKNFYILIRHDSCGWIDTEVIGKYGDKFVKFVDEKQLSIDGFSNSNDVKISVKDNKISLNFDDDGKVEGPHTPKHWQCILTWDDAAQWFSIETKDL